MFDLLLKQVAEAWASFSSEMKDEESICIVIFVCVGYLHTYWNDAALLKTFLKLLWEFPKEPEKILV